MLPPDPGVQHEQDPLQHQPVIERLTTRIAKAARPHRQHRLDPRPQTIRHIPPPRPHRHRLSSLTTDADELRYRRTGPFIELEVLSDVRTADLAAHRPAAAVDLRRHQPATRSV